MAKKLTEMSLEELWQLFPIRLVPHNGEWADRYAEMAAVLSDRLGKFGIVRISHIGSTAIPDISAKPIIDILVEIPNDQDMNEVSRTIEDTGFLKMSECGKRMSFNLGYTENGFADKVYHLHLRFAGDNDELYFRDLLCERPEIAKEYEALKLRLWKCFEHDRDGYTSAKTDFIKHYTSQAKALYPDRYTRI